MKKVVRRYWEARELVLIGVFAAAAKLSSLLIALAGGGMNPVSLVLKNLVYTTLMIVLLKKVQKEWSLLLFTVIGMIVSVGLMGGSLTLLPAAITGALMAELVMKLTGGAKTSWGPYLAVAIFDLASKGLSLGVSFLFMRESPALMTMIVPIVICGYLGSLIGLWFGWKTVGELKHAGFVRS